MPPPYAVSFSPAFQHEEWVDNQDRVQAGGSNGFNVRFNLLKADLDDVSSAVGEVNTALNELAQAPAALEVPVSIAPVLTRTGPTGWDHRIGFAEKPAGGTTAAGMASVSLRHGGTIEWMRATGRNSGAGELRISLWRQGLAADAVGQRIVNITPTGDPFDQTVAADSTLAVVDAGTYRYYVLAQLNGALGTDVVMLAGFQISVVGG